METLTPDAQAHSAKIAKEAVSNLLLHIGEDPLREGLVDTPRRFVKAFDEWFAGYKDNPDDILSTYFEEVGGYDEMVMLRRIPFESHCEHHIAPIIGHATVAYIPTSRVIGISKLARLVDCFAKRLQVQERMTSQIADALENNLSPFGVAVIITASHHCMMTRGVHKEGVDMITSEMRGLFRDDNNARGEILSLHNARK